MTQACKEDALGSAGTILSVVVLVGLLFWLL